MSSNPQDRKEKHNWRQNSSKPGALSLEQLNAAFDDENSALSADEIEQIIECVEAEYGTSISSEMRKVIREEISGAVPELTGALLPLFTAAEEENPSNYQEIQQECVKSFLQIMVPHMQKIVRSAQ